MIQRQRAIRDNNVLTQREDSEGLICLCPSPHTTSRNKKKAAIPSPKTNIEKKRNKKRFFLSPQKNFAKREKKGWGRLTACIAGHAIQRKNPQDESQRFSKWRLPTLPRCNAVPSAMLSLTTLFGMGRGGTSAL